MDTKQANPVKRAMKRYFIEFGAAMGAYVIVMLIRGRLFEYWEARGALQHMARGWVIAMAVLPVVPLWFIFWAVVRYLRGMDELWRRITVDSLAVAGGVTALLAATYGFIEGDAFPHLSAWWTYSVFMVTWLIAGKVVARRYR